MSRTMTSEPRAPMLNLSQLQGSWIKVVYLPCSYQTGVLHLIKNRISRSQKVELN